MEKPETTADTAVSAVTADTAVSAVTADTAVSAVSADTADTAVSADTVDTAVSADTADTAVSADTVDTAATADTPSLDANGRIICRTVLEQKRMSQLDTTVHTLNRQILAKVLAIVVYGMSSILELSPQLALIPFTAFLTIAALNENLSMVLCRRVKKAADCFGGLDAYAEIGRTGNARAGHVSGYVFEKISICANFLFVTTLVLIDRFFCEYYRAPKAAFYLLGLAAVLLAIYAKKLVRRRMQQLQLTSQNVRQENRVRHGYLSAKLITIAAIAIAAAMKN